MSGEGKYQPPEHELADIEENIMTATEREQSAEREQRKFEENTFEGFKRLKDISGDKEKFLQAYFGVAKELPEEMKDIQILRPYFFMYQLFGGNKPLSEVKSNFLNDVNVVEIAGMLGSLRQWPSRDAFEFSGANYMGTDIAAIDEDKVVSTGQISEIKKVDALIPGQSLAGRKFDAAFCLGLFGHPTDQIAKSLNTRVRSVEDHVFSERDKLLRQGSVFIIGSIDDLIKIDLKKAKGMGYGIIDIPTEFTVPTKYIIARKNGMYEAEEPTEGLLSESQTEAA